MSVNKVILLGRLGKDPELKHTNSGTAVCNFPLATDNSWKGKDGEKQKETTWHNIVVWAKQAEVIAEHFSKGKEIFIEGRIANRSYEDKEGVKKYISEVVVTNFSFTGGKKEDQEENSFPELPSEPEEEKKVDDEDDDLPF